MKVKELSGGIDVGSAYHHVVVLDEGGKPLYDRKVSHRLEAFRDAIEELREKERIVGGKISFGMEGRNGYGAPFDRILRESGFPLYNIDNLKLRRFRDVFGAAWRNDRRDARMLAKLMKLRYQLNGEREKAFIPVQRVPLVHEKLKIISRHQEELISEKVRLCNRLGKKLLEVSPGILDMFKKVESKKLLRLLVRYPDFSRYKRIRRASLLKIRGVGQKSADRLIGRLRALAYVESLVDVYAMVIRSLAERILALQEEIAMLNRKMEKLGEASVSVQRLRSIPGVATKLSSRLMGEIGTIHRFKNANQLAVYCGVGCINDDSGKRKVARAVFKANKICKQTMVTLAGCTIRFCPESRRYYRKKRDEGKGHNHALRCLARQLIKVIFRLLTENRDYYVDE
jgi:transposase